MNPDADDAPPVVFGPIDGPVALEAAPADWHRDRRLALWTVYSHATDQPDLFVARRHVIRESGEPIPTNLIVAHRELEPVRRRLRILGLTCLGRDPDDEPQIVESWI